MFRFRTPKAPTKPKKHSRFPTADADSRGAGPAVPTAELEALAGQHAVGLELDGRPLPAPHFHEVDWRVGQMFTAADDPDRTTQPWTPPEWLDSSDPKAQEVTVEDIPVPEQAKMSFGGRASSSRSSSFESMIRIVHNVISPRDCAALLASVSVKGYTPALLNCGGGQQCLQPGVRDGHRAVVDTTELSGWLGAVLGPHLPASGPETSTLRSINERMRFLCYTPGQQFAGHTDGRYTCPKTGHSSHVTLQLYLHDVPEPNGGATTFFPDTPHAIPFQPKAGSVLMFTQDLYHEGSLLSAGIKYTVRTEAMYGHG